MTKRESYWNQSYTEYWKKKVSEANLNILNDDNTISDKIYNNSISLLNLNKKDSVLEMGVGFGRSLPFLSQIANHIYALDISESMINEAKKFKKKNISFFISPSENTPFENQKFDKIICFACFDAMYQHEALIEMNRILKVGGKILLTGKNDDYFTDDSLAVEAEIGARSKNHPNYFTDYKILSKNINKFGLKINLEKFFLRRGDFSKELFLNHIQSKFYEYLVILEKINEAKISKIKISDVKSKTFKRKKFK